MKILIEVVADSREEALTLLSDATKALKKNREDSGATVNSCIGDYRITVDDKEEPEPPYQKDDPVKCIDRTSAYIDQVGMVEHSGPRATGVQWPGAERVMIHPNGALTLVEG